MYGGEGPGFKSTRWLWSFYVEFGFSIRPTMQLLSSSPLFTRGCHSGSSACLIGQKFYAGYSDSSRNWNFPLLVKCVNHYSMDLLHVRSTGNSKLNGNPSQDASHLPNDIWLEPHTTLTCVNVVKKKGGWII